MRVIATYAGQDLRGHHLLKDVLVDGDFCDRRWLNGLRSNFPGNVPVGCRVKFFASPVMTKVGQRLTDCREVEVIS